MTTLYQWAQRWQVPMAAIQDLERTMGMLPDPLAPPPHPSNSEAWVQSAVRLAASQKGVRLWRNNVGALQDTEGRWVRFGLANDSRAMNVALKSSDLIGVRPIAIGPEHIGHRIGQFCSWEIKHPTWTYSGTEREVAQSNWIRMVTALGGDAKFLTGPGAI